MSMQSVRVQLDDSPLFEATADLGDKWNGSLRPRFTLDQVREVAKYTQAMNREHGVDWETVHVVEQRTANRFAEEGAPSVETSALVLWVSWEFKLNSEGPSKWVTVVDPDQDGLYDIGGGSWAWSHVPEPERTPVSELKPLAGRHVHFVGEFDDPWDIATGEVELTNPAEAYMVIGNDGDGPMDNSYFSFTWEELELEDMAQIIADLPVCLVMTHADMETGLCPTEKGDGWQWSLVEAFTRLGMVPPVEDYCLSNVLDIPRSPELVAYLVDAYRTGVEHSVESFRYMAEKKVEYLDKIASEVLPSK